MKRLISRRARTERTFYQASELRFEEVVDLDIKRHKPLVLKLHDGRQGIDLVIQPVTLAEQGLFLRQLGEIIDKISAVLTLAELCLNQRGTGSFRVSMARRRSEKEFDRLRKKDLPSFLLRWCCTTKGSGDEIQFVKIHSFRTLRNILGNYDLEQVAHIIVALKEFNMDYPAHVIRDFQRSLGMSGSRQAMGAMPHSMRTEKSVRESETLKYSDEVYRNLLLMQLEQASSRR